MNLWTCLGIGFVIWVVISAGIVVIACMAKSRRDQKDGREV